MTEKSLPVYLFDDSRGELSQMLPWAPGEIIGASPGIRLIELHPDRPARVISFDGIIDEPGAEAEVEHASKWMLTDEGLKKCET